MKGYATVSAAATTASICAGVFSIVARPMAIRARATNRVNASYGATAPVASGRVRVRSTYGSILRSTKSFSTQPAERMTNTPIMKTRNRPWSGVPSPASHSAHNVGHISNQMPIGLSTRISLP